MKLTYKVI